MLEQEAWGELSKDQFEEFLRLFGERFGEPGRHRRLSISFWNHEMNEIDTRIRITDGVAEIMQKVGQWEGVSQWDRSEIHLKLASDPQQIFNAYKILRNLLPEHEVCHFIRFDNFVFRQPDFEIKLAHQSGKSNKYNFEVEFLNDQAELDKHRAQLDDKSDLDVILKSLGLTDLVTVTNEEFWNKWNEELNLSDMDLKEEQIIELIKEYL